MIDIENMSKEELLELRESLTGVDQSKKEAQSKEKKPLDPKIEMAVNMLRISLINSRAYADSVNTEEKRLEQIDRVQKALDRAAYREACAYWHSYNGKPLK